MKIPLQQGNSSTSENIKANFDIEGEPLPSGSTDNYVGSIMAGLALLCCCFEVGKEREKRNTTFERKKEKKKALFYSHRVNRRTS